MVSVGGHFSLKNEALMRYGVFGAGHLGKIHMKCIQESDQLELAGFYDPDPQAAAKAAETFGVPAFPSTHALLEACDIADIVTPTITHYALACDALAAGRDVFIEKPVTHTITEAEDLIRRQHEQGRLVQVGHVERFNPAFLALGQQALDPRFIEGHRLATFNPRGTDVSVVLDLMIHDLDILLNIVNAPVVDIAANGVSVVSPTPDICNARITFENGCVANLTASRISLKQMRKMRIFQPDAYISVDFLERKSSLLRMFQEPPADGQPAMTLETPQGTRWITMETPEAGPVNAIRMELETFAQCVAERRQPPVPLEDGLEALRVAYEILDKINTNAANQ